LGHEAYPRAQDQTRTSRLSFKIHPDVLHSTAEAMLIMVPNHRRASQYLALQPVPLAFLVGLLMGLFGALIWMDDDRSIHDRRSQLCSMLQQRGRPLSIHHHHSIIKHIDDIPMRQTSHGTLKQQLVEPFALHPHLAGISIATLKEGERVERHAHATMFEFFYVLDGTLLIRDDIDETLWKECTVESQEFSVKSGAGPVRMMVYQLTTTTDTDTAITT
jgi:hypothetical protein